jgi:hypothetical protein
MLGSGGMAGSYLDRLHTTAARSWADLHLSQLPNIALPYSLGALAFAYLTIALTHLYMSVTQTVMVVVR